MFCIYTILAFFRWLFGGTNDCSLTLLVTTTAEYRQTKTGFWAQLGSKCMSKIPAPMCSTCFKSYPVITMWKKLLRQGDKIFLLLWGKIFGKYQSEIFTWKLVIVCTFPICSFARADMSLYNLNHFKTLFLNLLSPCSNWGSYLVKQTGKDPLIYQHFRCPHHLHSAGSVKHQNAILNVNLSMIYA